MTAAETGCVTLWVGDALGPVERACLRSVVRQGHSLALYCYAEPAGVPEQVEVRDASDILPLSEIPASWMSRADLYSDWFRYELQRRRLGIWLDTDVYLLRPLDLERQYLFGRESPALLNNAVLRLAADGPLLSRLLEPFHRRTTPRWLPWRTYLPMRIGEFLHGGADLARLPWGTTSPHALTALSRELGLLELAEPADVFYPAPWQDAAWIRDSSRSLEGTTTPRTVAVHLWNEVIKAFKNDPAPAGSFLQRLQREGA